MIMIRCIMITYLFFVFNRFHNLNYDKAPIYYAYGIAGLNHAIAPYS